MKKIIATILSIFLCLSAFAQSHFSSQSHQGSITNLKLVPSKNSYDFQYFSSGEDGFLIKWDEGNQGEHYQLTEVGIKMIAISPNGNDVAIYESDGGSVNKVSVWDWRTLQRKFMKRYSDSITALSYSAKGTYLMVGTATVNGAEFYNTATYSKVSKIKSSTSIVNYIKSSNTEKTVVCYSPSGSLSYFNMQNGSLKEKFNIVQGLNQTVLYNDNIFFAGVKDNIIYVINAFKGTTVTSIKASNPIIISGPDDDNLYYLENDGKNNYELKMLENLEDNTVSNPRIVKTLKGPRGTNAITAGIKRYTDIVLGGRNGTLYKIDSEPSITVTNMEQISVNEYSPIFDMTPAATDFYFLTEKSIFKSSYDTGIVDKLASTNGETNILSYSDNEVILWSKSTNKSVELLNLDTKVKTVLFTPKQIIQSLRISNIQDKKYLIDIESNSYVNLYDFENKTFKEIYSGTGIQDAILTDDGNMYISKTAATNPQVPLLCVNLQTYETVPMSLNGNVSYGLSTDGKMIYGIVLQSDDNGQYTYVYSFNTATKRAQNLLKFAEEDSDAFTYLYGNTLYTNIGKNKVYSYNMSTKKRFAYARTASIPRSICQNGSRVIILNIDGSVSWCGTTSTQLTADWYLTTDEKWFAF